MPYPHNMHSIDKLLCIQKSHFSYKTKFHFFFNLVSVVLVFIHHLHCYIHSLSLKVLSLSFLIYNVVFSFNQEDWITLYYLKDIAIVALRSKTTLKKCCIILPPCSVNIEIVLSLSSPPQGLPLIVGLLPKLSRVSSLMGAVLLHLSYTERFSTLFLSLPHLSKPISCLDIYNAYQAYYHTSTTMTIQNQKREKTKRNSKVWL